MSNFSFAVLISGNGSNLQAMIEAIEVNLISGKICCVVSNKEDAYGLERAKKVKIPTEIVNNKNFETREDFDAELVTVLSAYKPDLVVLAGFMRILTPKFIKAYRLPKPGKFPRNLLNKRFINKYHIIGVKL